MIGENVSAVDLDGTERRIIDIAARYDLTVRAIYHRLDWREGKWHLRPAKKSGRRPYKHLEGKEAA